MSTNLAKAYRPTSLDGIIGQRNVVAVLKNLIANQWAMPQSFIIQGISGCGKTTLARIVAESLGCQPHNIKEESGGVISWQGNMPGIVDITRYAPLGDPPVRSVIINEAEKLKDSAWNVLHEALEEPPEHTYWFLCTTDISAIPETIKSRCTPLNLFPVRPQRIRERLVYIRDKEKFVVSDEVLDLVADNADGSVRTAINHLSLLRDIEDVEQAKNLLAAVDSDTPLIKKFCSGLSKYITGEIDAIDLTRLLFTLRGYNPAKICEVVDAYWTKVAERKTEEGDVSAVSVISDTILKHYVQRPSSWGALLVMFSKWLNYVEPLHIKAVQTSGK